MIATLDYAAILKYFNSCAFSTLVIYCDIFELLNLYKGISSVVEKIKDFRFSYQNVKIHAPDMQGAVPVDLFRKIFTEY